MGVGFIYKGFSEGLLLLLGGVAVLGLAPFLFFTAAVMSLIPGAIAGLIFFPVARLVRDIRGARIMLLMHSALCGYSGAWAALFMWTGWQSPTSSGGTLLGLILGVCAGISAGALLMYSRWFANDYSPLRSVTRNV